MKISIITICKNEVETIEATLLSILNQSYKDFELIVVDGVSTDGTLDVIKRYQDKIAHFISEPDTGIFNAMNKGIKLATGDLLYFLNANDTLYDEQVFEKVVKAFKNNPDVMLSFGDAYFVNLQNNTKSLFNYTKLYDSYFLFFKSNPCHQTMFYKKELFQKYGLYDENYRIGGDTDKNMNLLLKQKVKAIYLPFAIANYSMDGLSSSLKMRKIINKERKMLYKKYYFKGVFEYNIYNLSKLLKYFSPQIYIYCKKSKLLNLFFKTAKINVTLVEVS